MVGWLVLWFNSTHLKNPLFLVNGWQEMGEREEWREGVQMFRSRESKKAVIWVFVRVHVSILLIRFQFFSFSLFWIQGQQQQQLTREREFHVLMRRKWVFGPLIDCFHWQFPLVCTRILTSAIDWKGGCYQVCLKNASKSICLPSPLFLMNVDPYFHWVSVHQTIQNYGIWRVNHLQRMWILLAGSKEASISKWVLLSCCKMMNYSFRLFLFSCLPFQWIVHFNWFRFHFPCHLRKSNSFSVEPQKIF